MQSRFFWGSAIIVLEHKCACIKNQTSRFDFCMRFALVLFIPFFLVQLYRWFYIWFVWMPPVIFIGVFDFLSSAFGPDRAYLFSLSLSFLFSLSHSISLLRFSINATWRFYVDHHITNCTEADSTWHFEEKLPKKKKLFITPRCISATSSLISNDFGKRKLHDDYQSNIKKKARFKLL